MATKRKTIEVDMSKEFFTEGEVEHLSKFKKIEKLGSFWMDGIQLFRVSIGEELVKNSETKQDD